MSKRPRSDQNEASDSEDDDPITRPARIQTKPHERIRKAYEKSTDQNFNVWYGSTMMTFEERMEKKKNKEMATVRCIPSLDEGRTKAGPDSYICIHFARGQCHLGPNCKYFHRLPDDDFASRLDPGRDCFGRERHATDRDDMGGVGNFMRDCRTLFIQGLNTTSEVSEPLDTLVEKHFSDFGEIDRINVVHGKAVAFVTYKLRASAEFAKVAMAEQSLGHGEVLNVRWADDDPSPQAIKEERDKRLREAAVAIAKARKEVVDRMTVTPQYDFTAQYYQQYANSTEIVSATAYPDTDPQYAAAAAAAASAAAATGVDDDYVHTAGGDGDGQQREWTAEDWERYRQWYEYYYGVPYQYQQPQEQQKASEVPTEAEEKEKETEKDEEKEKEQESS